MERCPHCGRKTISASNKILCYNILTLYNFTHWLALRFMGMKCPECNKRYMPSLPLFPMFIAGIVLTVLQMFLMVLCGNKFLILLVLLLLFTCGILPWVLLGIVGLFFPCIKYSQEERKLIKPYSNGIIELKSNIKIKKMHIYGLRIYDEQQDNSSKKIFDDNVIPVRFIRKHGFESRWFVEIFNKDYIPKELAKDKTDFILLKNEKKVGNVTYRRVDSY